MTNKTPKKWTKAELSEMFCRCAADHVELLRNHREMLTSGIKVDKKTNTPYFLVVLPKGSDRDTSDIPAKVGVDQIPVKIKYHKLPKVVNG